MRVFRPTTWERFQYLFYYFFFFGLVPTFILSFFIGFSGMFFWLFLIGALCTAYFFNVIPLSLYEIRLVPTEIWVIDQGMGRFLFSEKIRIRRVKITEKLRIYYYISQIGLGGNRRTEFRLSFVAEPEEPIRIVYENMQSLGLAYKEIKKSIFHKCHLNQLIELIETKAEIYSLGKVGVSDSLFYLDRAGYKWKDIKEVVIGETIFEREWVVYFWNESLRAKRVLFPPMLKDEEYKFLQLLEYKLIKEQVKYRL